MVNKMSRSIASTIIVLTLLVLFAATNTFAQDVVEEEGSQFRITPELGIISLTGADRDFLEDGFGFGLSGTYIVKRPFFVRVAFLYSMHDGKDMPRGYELTTSIFSATPQIGFISDGKRLNYWIAGGVGPTFLKTEVDAPGDISGSQTETAAGVRAGAGIDYLIGDRFAFGSSVNYHTATNPVDSSDPDKPQSSTRTSIYLSLIASISYRF